ncbi:hypothetical protein [Streptomyces sp. NPDC058665]|uniref:hypothetical protein n=1 Tax=Streptomyces sp. NPDC058665 TaxID=3346586 RepID=UPI00364B962B
MPETTDSRAVPVPPAAALLSQMEPTPTAVHRVPSAELDQLRNDNTALDAFRQAVIDLCAGRPDTHLMTVAELRGAVGAPPTAYALPVTWPGDVIGPVGSGPRARTILPLATSHGTPAMLSLSDDERARLAGRLAATLHPAEPCTTPRCGESEGELDHYVDDDAPAKLGWIAVRVCGGSGPIRWWCSPACANSAITAAGADIAAAERTAAAVPVRPVADPGLWPSGAAPVYYTDRITGGALTRMMATAAAAVTADEPIPYDLDDRFGDGASEEYVSQLGEAADAAAADERGDVDDAAGGVR